MSDQKKKIFFFRMKILNKSVKSELSYLKTTPELRAIPNDISKAASILENYVGDVEFSMTEFCSFVCISRESVRKRMKAIVLGHTYHSHHNLKYLAPIHEQRLVDMIVTSHAQKIFQRPWMTTQYLFVSSIFAYPLA